MIRVTPVVDKVRGESPEFRVKGRERHSRTKQVGAEVAEPTLIHRRIVVDRRPQIGGCRVREVRRQLKVLWHHAEDDDRAIVDRDRLPDHGGVARKHAAPQVEAQDGKHRSVGFRGSQRFRFSKDPAVQGRRAQHFKRVGGHNSSVQARRFPIPGHRHPIERPHGHAIDQPAASADVAHIDRRDPCAIGCVPLAPDRDEAVLLFIGQRR
jgi:hypothetical protein